MTILFDQKSSPRVFTIPPEAPFVSTFLKGLKHRLKGQAFKQVLAPMHVVVNTQRAVRALRDTLIQEADGGTLLPSFHVIETFSQTMCADSLALPPLSFTRRHLLLTKLVRTFLDQRSDMGAVSSTSAMVRHLENLLDQSQSAGVSLEAIDSLNTDNNAAHWQTIRMFLSLLKDAWPQILKQENALDKEASRRHFTDELIARWRAHPPLFPILALGSTGSTHTTACLLEAIAKLPQGAIILPGLDTLLDEEAWRNVGPDHPQYALSLLLERFGYSRCDVNPWHGEIVLSERFAYLSEALRPAPVTDVWLKNQDTLKAMAPAAMNNVTLLEADNPQEEASMIACVLREALEVPETTAALVTPDGTLARRVITELTRWGISANDSAGVPLTTTPPGVLAMLALAVAKRQVHLKDILAVLKHPLVTLGYARVEHLQAVRTFERRILTHKDIIPLCGSLSQVQSFIENDGDHLKLSKWFDRFMIAARKLQQTFTDEDVSLNCRLTSHCEALEALTLCDNSRGDSLIWKQKDGAALYEIFQDLKHHEDIFPELSAFTYVSIVKDLISQISVHKTFDIHPRLSILGTLEARLQSADVMILGSLNEGVWPQSPSSGPWMSRGMMKEAGFPLPERRIGLSAHDFMQSAMAKRLILSRSVKSQGSPTSSSRWMLRLTTLLDSTAPEVLEQMRSRGHQVRAWVAHLSQPASSAKVISRPHPCPPQEARLQRLSVTDVKTLIRDPYALYAKRILGLYPVSTLSEIPGPDVQGRVLHNIVECFVKTISAQAMTHNAFMKIAERELRIFAPWPFLHAFLTRRCIHIARWFVPEEQARQKTQQVKALETLGRHCFKLKNKDITLTCRVDRIDMSSTGYHIYDYKSGRPPTFAQVQHFDQQLPLTAGLLMAGGFCDLPAGPIKALGYIHLSASQPKDHTLPYKDDLSSVAKDALENLKDLLRSYDNDHQGYVSHARPHLLSSKGDYDHLARVGEWDKEIQSDDRQIHQQDQTGKGSQI